MIFTLLPCQFGQQYNRYPQNLSTVPFVVNSHDSAVSLTIFYLFSRPHDKNLNLTVFVEKSF